MRYELKSISVWSTVKISFFMNLILGGVLGFFYALFIGLIVKVMGQPFFGSEMQFDPSEMSMIPLVFFFTIGGAIGGAFFHTILVALIVGLYNLFGKMTGGLILNLNAIEQPATQTIPVAAPVVAAASVTSARTTTVPPPPPPPAVEPERSLKEIREQSAVPTPPLSPEEPPNSPLSPPSDPWGKPPEQLMPKAEPPAEKPPEEKDEKNPETPPTW